MSGSPGTYSTLTTVDALAYTDGVTDHTVRWYKVRAVNFYGVTSAFSVQVNSNGRVISLDEIDDGNSYFRVTQTGTGVNVHQADFASFFGSKLPQTSFGPNITVHLDATTANCYGVPQNMTLVGTGTMSSYALNNGAGQYISLKPNSKWIVQMACRASSSGKQVRLALMKPGGSSYIGNTSWITAPNAPAGIISGVIDASADSDTQGFLRIEFQSGQWNSGDYLCVSYVGIEQQIGNCTTPSAWVPPPARTQDELQDGPTYGKTANADLYTVSGVNRIGLGQAGSGMQLGDALNMPPIAAMNLNYYWPNAPTYSASAGAPATATISVAATTVIIGSASVSYNAMSVGVTGTGGTTVTYYLYIDDPTYAGGSQTLHATTNSSTVYSGNGRVFVGGIPVTFPTVGGGTGGGGGGGGTGGKYPPQ